jgi:RHS repeat-associated protein
MSNAKGHLAEAYTGSSSSKTTDLGFSYSVRGETTDTYEMTPNSGGYFHVNVAYWANGAPNTLAAVLGASSLFPMITYGVNGEGRPYSASAATGQNPLVSTSYNPASQVTALNYGSLDSDAFGFDNADRPTSYQFQVNGSTVSGLLTWNPNHSLGSLAINNPFNSADTQTCNYTHDDLQRTASVSCSGANAWAQTFTYDAFGNISKSGSSSFAAGYSTSTNQITGIPNVAYDTNGNLTSINSDYLHSYSWDSDGNQVYVDGIQVTFDAMDRAVEQLSSGSYKQILYTTSGSKLALVSGGALLEAFVPLPGNAAAVYNSSGLTYYRHPDWLGSSRFASTTTRTMYYSGSYAPFGESYSEAGTPDRSFTGQNQDTEIGQYDFLYRNYSSVQGRWISPDPAGLGAIQAGNPQTWNRYAYVINRPLKSVDSSGLFAICIDGDCYGRTMDMDNSGGGGDSGVGNCSAQYSFDECGGMQGIVNGTFGDATGAISQECAGLNSRQCQALLAWEAQVAQDQSDNTDNNTDNSDCDQSGDGSGEDSSSGGWGADFSRRSFHGSVYIHPKRMAQNGSSSSSGKKSCSPNNGTQQPQQPSQPQHFWQKPGCGAALGQLGIGLAGTAITAGAIGASVYLGPEMFEGAELLMNMSHLGPLVAPGLVMTVQGAAGAWNNCR